MKKSYKLIPLTQGHLAIVDAKDYDWLNQWRWFAWRPYKGGPVYARRAVTSDGKTRAVAMHNLILGRKKSKVGDHWNGCTLDNRRCNLRHLSRSENKRNREGSKLREGCPEIITVKPPKNFVRPLMATNSTGFENIVHSNGKWVPRIRIKGKDYSLGGYDAPEEARAVYEEAAQKRDSNPRWRPKLKPSSRNTSGHRGISWHKASRKWRVTTTVNCEVGRKHLHVGTFSTLKEAKGAARKNLKQTMVGSE